MSQKIWKAKLAPFNYQIVFSPMDSSDHGSTDLDEKKIFINTKFDIQTQKETLLHELQHVAYEDCSLFKHPISDADDQEEQLIRFSNPKLWQFLRDNRRVREFIFE